MFGRAELGCCTAATKSLAAETAASVLDLACTLLCVGKKFSVAKILVPIVSGRKKQKN